MPSPPAAKGAGGQVREEGVVLGVGRGHDHGLGPRDAEHHLAQGGQAVGVQVLDDRDPAQGLEQLAHQGLAAARGQGRDDGVQRDRRLGQLGPLARGSGHGRSQGAGQGHRQKGRGGVGAVIDVLVQQALAPALAAHQADGVDVQHQGRVVSLRLG